MGAEGGTPGDEGAEEAAMTTASKLRQLEIVAHHEAGHMVAALAAGLKPDRVMIRAKTGRMAGLRFSSDPDQCFKLPVYTFAGPLAEMLYENGFGTADFETIELSMEEAMVLTMEKAMEERKYGPWARDYFQIELMLYHLAGVDVTSGARSFIAMARKFCDPTLHVTPEQRRKIAGGRRMALRLAFVILARNWGKVQILGKALLERGSLSSGQVKRLIGPLWRPGADGGGIGSVASGSGSGK